MNQTILIYTLSIIILGTIFYYVYTYKGQNHQKIKRNTSLNPIIQGTIYQNFNDDNVLGNFNQAIAYYNKAINDPNTRADGYLHLARLYHNGMPDRITDSGVKVNGVLPNPEKAIYYYNKLFELGNPNYKIYILDLASIYHWGVPGFDGNREMAKELYTQLFKSGSYYERCMAADRLRQMDEEINDKTSIYNNNGSLHQNKWSEYFPNLAYSAQVPHVASVFSGSSMIDNIMKSQKKKTDRVYNLPNLNKITKIPTNKNTIVKRQSNALEIKNDMHNVHDHIVNNTIKQAISKLQNSTSLGIDMTCTLKQIRNTINDSCQKELSGLDKNSPDYKKNINIIKQKEKDAIQALDDIEKNNSYLSASNTKEVDLLHLVWNRIHNPINKDNKETLTQNLVNELSECVENGKTVCTSGRFNRIIDSLNAVDPDVSIKPKWAIQNEMMSKASNIRNQMLNNCSTFEKAALETIEPTETQQKAQDQFTERLKENITNTFHTEYVDTGIMSKELLEAELNKWINDL